jgi:hypothetical protein
VEQEASAKCAWTAFSVTMIVLARPVLTIATTAQRMILAVFALTTMVGMTHLESALPTLTHSNIVLIKFA